MNIGDIFTFSGDKYVSRGSNDQGMLASKLVNKGGVEKPTVGKPRLFRTLDGMSLVGHMALADAAKRKGRTVTPEAPKTILADLPADPTPQPTPSIEEKRVAIQRMLDTTESSKANKGCSNADLPW